MADLSINNAAIMAMATLSGITGESHHSTIVFGNDTGGGTAARPDIGRSAKTRKDLLNARKFKAAEEQIKSRGLQWYTGG